MKKALLFMTIFLVLIFIYVNIGQETYNNIVSFAVIFFGGYCLFIINSSINDKVIKISLIVFVIIMSFYISTI